MKIYIINDQGDRMKYKVGDLYKLWKRMEF